MTKKPSGLNEMQWDACYERSLVTRAEKELIENFQGMRALLAITWALQVSTHLAISPSRHHAITPSRHHASEHPRARPRPKPTSFASSVKDPPEPRSSRDASQTAPQRSLRVSRRLVCAAGGGGDSEGGVWQRLGGGHDGAG